VPELLEALPGIEIIDRSSVNAFDDARVARAIEATGRKKLIFVGISLEVCAAFPAITPSARAWMLMWPLMPRVLSARRSARLGSCACCRRASSFRIYTTLIVEILKDNARPEAGEVYGAMDMGWAKLVGQIAHAYGK
jgi:hypothetical protein